MKTFILSVLFAFSLVSSVSASNVPSEHPAFTFNTYNDTIHILYLHKPLYRVEFTHKYTYRETTEYVRFHFTDMRTGLDVVLHYNKANGKWYESYYRSWNHYRKGIITFHELK